MGSLRLDPSLVKTLENVWSNHSSTQTKLETQDLERSDQNAHTVVSEALHLPPSNLKKVKPSRQKVKKQKKIFQKIIRLRIRRLLIL